jgi:hypothetical protein
MIAREATSALGRLGRVVRIGGGRFAGTTLTLSIVGAPPVEAGPADPRWRGYPVEVHESDRGVEVLVREQLSDVDCPPDHGMSRMGWSILLPVHLSRPLAERVVVDLGSNLTVPVVHGLLTASPATGWTLRAEPGGSPWVQQFTGPAGHLTVAQGPVAIGTMSQPAFYEQTGVTTVRGVPGQWGSGPGERSLHWVEDGHGMQLMSSSLDVEELVDIADRLTLAD